LAHFVNHAKTDEPAPSAFGGMLPQAKQKMFG